MSPNPTSSEKMRAARRASEGKRRAGRVGPASGILPKRARILVVEDELSLGRALVRWLKEYDVVHVEGLAPMLERIRAGERFDVVLCDVMMPGGNAPQVQEALSREASDLVERTFYMTGGATTPDTIAFVAKHGNRLLSKPLDLKELRKRLLAFFEEHPAAEDDGE